MKFFKNDHAGMVAFISVVCIGVLCFVLLIISNKSTTEDSDEKKVKCDTENWALIENEDFELDMEKMDIVLIKRSFNEGGEVTLIELANGKQRHFVCSRSIHQRLVNEFRKIKESRKEGGN